MTDEQAKQEFGPGQKPTEVSPESAQQERYVAALKREREGYVQAGKKDRVKAVDAELKRLGVEPDPQEQSPKGRARRPQHTTDQADGQK